MTVAADEHGENVERVAVRVTEDVGRILGTDGAEYDLAAGDEVSLPRPNAIVLLSHDAAKAVDADARAGDPDADDRGQTTLGGWSE